MKTWIKGQGMYDTNSLLEACQAGNLERIKKFPDDSFEVRSNGGETPLMVAIRHGHKEVVNWLLENNKANITATNDNKDSALIVALEAEKHRDDFVKMLLHYENIDLHVQSYFWGTALTYAIFSKQFDNALLLLSKEKSFQLSYHPGALHWAVKQGNHTIVLALKALGVDLNTTKYLGFDPCEDWVWKSMPSSSPFSFREKDTTPLLVALNEMNHSMVALLLENGADPNLTCQGQTPLIVAAENADQASLELLVQHGADLKQRVSDGTKISDIILDSQYIEDMIKRFINNILATAKITSSSASPMGYFNGKRGSLNEVDPIKSALEEQLPTLLTNIAKQNACSIETVVEIVPEILLEIRRALIERKP
jgi:ankyrin repeat protein